MAMTWDAHVDSITCPLRDRSLEAINPLPYVGRSMMVVGLDTLKAVMLQGVMQG